MGFCFDLPNHAPVCVGNAFSQLNSDGIGMTETGVGLFAIVAITVFAFILKSQGAR